MADIIPISQLPVLQLNSVTSSNVLPITSLPSENDTTYQLSLFNLDTYIKTAAGSGKVFVGTIDTATVSTSSISSSYLNYTGGNTGTASYSLKNLSSSYSDSSSYSKSSSYSNYATVALNVINAISIQTCSLAYTASYLNYSPITSNGTASFAISSSRTVSASYALSSSNSISSSYSLTSSNTLSSSYALSCSYVSSSSYSLSSSFNVSSSYSVSSSYAPNISNLVKAFGTFYLTGAYNTSPFIPFSGSYNFLNATPCGNTAQAATYNGMQTSSGYPIPSGQSGYRDMNSWIFTLATPLPTKNYTVIATSGGEQASEGLWGVNFPISNRTTTAFTMSMQGTANWDDRGTEMDWISVMVLHL